MVTLVPDTTKLSILIGSLASMRSGLRYVISVMMMTTHRHARRNCNTQYADQTAVAAGSVKRLLGVTAAQSSNKRA